MVKIVRENPSGLGYGFIPGNEYRFRFEQNPRADYRNLTAGEIALLEQGGSRSENWDAVLVTGSFQPGLVKNCRFFGLVRIGDLEECQLQYHDLKLPCGLYDSTIISCDLGDWVALHNVRYLSHYIVEKETILFNIDEMSVTNHAKFGNGTLTEGESEEIRVSVEVANEKGTRDIFPFVDMLPGDGWLWAKFREKKILQESFHRWTNRDYSREPGHYGRVGRGSVLKSCRIIKDVIFGEGSYVKGANKLKNLTLGGTAEQPVHVGEGTELVNGIVRKGARIFYGAKAVRFVLGEESQLSYGARLINSYVGDNSTISCCEVLNALIFPFHEQHHNNSFLIASVLQGQSNMAAGATVGSNHNSRGADGEILASRGFWPGLNVSLKHNSRFAPFTLISKGAYPAELDIPLPFSLLSNDESQGMLTVMPAYWFHYNMYALARNSWKYRKRDKRRGKIQSLEFHYLAPDSLEALREGRKLLASWCGRENLEDDSYDPGEIILKKHALEKGRRPARILRPARAWRTYGRITEYSFALNLLEWRREFSSLEDVKKALEKGRLMKWHNLGGQLVSDEQLDRLEEDIRGGRIDSWEDLHEQYVTWGEEYPREKLRHSAACWLEQTGEEEFSVELLEGLMRRASETAEDLFDVTRSSRAKDFTQDFRKITFDNSQEMTAVLGRLEEDEFIAEQERASVILAVGREEFLQSIRRQ